MFDFFYYVFLIIIPFLIEPQAKKRREVLIQETDFPERKKMRLRFEIKAKDGFLWSTDGGSAATSLLTTENLGWALFQENPKVLAIKQTGECLIHSLFLYHHPLCKQSIKTLLMRHNDFPTSKDFHH